MFKNGAAQNGSRQKKKKKKGLNAFGKWQQLATVSATRLLFLDTTFLLCPLHLSQVTSFWTRGRPRGYDVTPHISILKTTHALLREQCVRRTEGTFWLALPHSQLFLSLPVPPSHSFPLPALIPLSPSLSLPLSLSFCLPPYQFHSPFLPLLTLPPSLPLYLRLLFFYSKLNLSL